jgi:hypothetical protein
VLALGETLRKANATLGNLCPGMGRTVPRRIAICGKMFGMEKYYHKHGEIPDDWFENEPSGNSAEISEEMQAELDAEVERLLKLIDRARDVPEIAGQSQQG